jgi:hypothetical protein
VGHYIWHTSASWHTHSLQGRRAKYYREVVPRLAVSEPRTHADESFPLSIIIHVFLLFLSFLFSISFLIFIFLLLLLLPNPISYTPFYYSFYSFFLSSFYSISHHSSSYSYNSYFFIVSRLPYSFSNFFNLPPSVLYLFMLLIFQSFSLSSYSISSRCHPSPIPRILHLHSFFFCFVGWALGLSEFTSLSPEGNSVSLFSQRSKHSIDNKVTCIRRRPVMYFVL